jgi:hypothetical protein
MTTLGSSAGSTAYAVVLVALLTWFSRGLSAQTADAPHPSPVHQLRIYEIFEHNKQAFHERFRDHAMRIMAKYDFRIVYMWESRTPERTEFVYLLEWPSRAVLEDRWTKFMADEEWADIKRQSAAAHGQLVGRIESRELTRTPYTPRGSLLGAPPRAP